MKRIILILIAALLCTSCTALPAEERAFAVALAVDGGPGAWRVWARIPTYQSGGGYATVQGEGDTLEGALAALDAAAPQQLHPGQLRLIVFTRQLAQSEALPMAIAALAARQDLRMDAALAVTEDDPAALMDAMTPASGSRLSKSLDTQMEARIAQGVLIPAPLSVVCRMGERQSPVLMGAQLREGSVELSGCWPVGTDGRAGEPLSPEDTQLLALLLGTMKRGALTLPGGAGTVHLTDASADAELSLPTMQSAAVRLTLQGSASPQTGDGLSQSVATAVLNLLKRLSAGGCDALGLGRQAIVHAENMAHWHEMAWPEKYRDLTWTVSVGAEM